MANDLSLRTCTPDDLPELLSLVSAGFLRDAPDDDAIEARRDIFEPERVHVTVDRDRLVGTAGVLTREMTIPGAVTPAAHVTAVVVAPTHRRRGVLSRMMAEQLRAVRERGDEPFATLWASEGGIYGRFGYGLASWNVAYEIAPLQTGFHGDAPAGRLRQGVPAELRKTLADIHDRARPLRPGISSLSDAWWRYRTRDPENRRQGMTASQAVVYEGESGAEGYALWRTKARWAERGPDGEAHVAEVVAATDEAYRALWRFVLSLDLVRTVRCDFAAVDEPLAHLVTNSYALGASVRPGLWVRLVDVPAALAARRYAAPLDVVVEVTDDMLPENAGRWRLTGDRTSASCEPTTAGPDLTLDVRELGAIYLGGTPLHSLAVTRKIVEHRPGAAAAVSAAFGWDRAPWSHEMF
ncbi:GNAT family N-acetyltransferase [Phytoactinopolyspora halotolerans]|uniref:GNAT family N-acetyltransferase n=1 Tax=Phytoactinopolyspora halotolerans TaxID=1981512 RepID=A0A6L9S5H1_9ACTN|nr:GNAT family N-acetyltransferase [Phytoactinopolyspora halotolerans]NED99990.1 GNAT family N-acetyltransferase [Phytoactinopolyspora halotolerans]